MNIPQAVIGIKPLRVNDEYLPYCKELNQIIRRWAMSGTASRKQSFAGTIYTYEDDNVTFVYQDSDYGNDHYQLAISCDVWNSLPPDINPGAVIENGRIYVYHFQDSPDRQVLLHHIPGSWYDSIQKYH